VTKKADYSEEEWATLRKLETSRFGLLGIRKGAALISEQF